MSSMYVFKGIKPVSPSNELIDIILSRTQRKTPTEIHHNFAISRIRSFYMRKVKFTAQNFSEKLTSTVESFPKVEEIHPFFADLINILYDKDHYKIALSQVNVVKGIIDNIAKDYVKLLKYGDSLYRCKTLKRAALGRMCTAVKKIGPSLVYLEEVRRHLGRLPCVDAFAPSVLVFGFPNVGKSSFLNHVSNAKIEVSPMAFSTQSLFVGHSLHKNVKIQFIDSPGVLERALEERNTIEMQSLTALAHLQTAVLFLIDVSESSGYSIEEQIKLYRDLKPLYAKKPILVGLTKIDLLDGSLDQENPEDSEQLRDVRAHLLAFKEEEGIELVEFSNERPEMVEEVRIKICDKLLEHRMGERRMGDNKRLKTDEDYLMGVTVQMPTMIRASVKVRPHIPQAVLEKRRLQALKKTEEANQTRGTLNDENDNTGLEMEGQERNYRKIPEWVQNKMKRNKTGKYMNRLIPKRRTLRDVQEEMGGAGVFNFPMQEHFMLEKQEWKYDKVPEIWNGINITDYVDPDIDRKLAELEAEEEQRLAQKRLNITPEQEANELAQMEQERLLLQEIEGEKYKIKMDHRINNKRRKFDKNQMLSNLREKLASRDQPKEKILKRIRGKVRARKRANIRGEQIEIEGQERVEKVRGQGKRLRRGTSVEERAISLRAKSQLKNRKAERVKRRIEKKINIDGRKGPGDRSIYVKKPKHLFAGKMSNGTRNKR